MKKFSIALNILLIAGFVHFGCNLKQIVSNNNNLHCTTCDTPFTGVLARKFIEVVARYRQTHADIITKEMRQIHIQFPDMAPEDSRCVWFSLDTLKKFICEIETYSKAMKIGDDSLGVRFYYAVYPGGPSDDFKAADYGSRFGQHTIYMVPTVVEDNDIVDFDPLQSVDSGHIKSMASLITNKSMFPDSKQNLFILGGNGEQKPTPTSNQSTTSYSWNNGRLCPTNCPTEAANTLSKIDTLYKGGLPY